MDQYFIVHIETCPADIESYSKLDEEEQKKLLNPIDSKIVAIGIRHAGQNLVSMERSEKDMLRDFWQEWERISHGKDVAVVGFNITSFDLPFIVARSFIHDVPISPFLLKNVIDLRDKINAYRYGPTRGRLSEYAIMLGQPMEDTDTVKLCAVGDFTTVKNILVRDLQLIDALYEKARRTRIIDIRKW